MQGINSGKNNRYLSCYFYYVYITVKTFNRHIFFKVTIIIINRGYYVNCSQKLEQQRQENEAQRRTQEQRKLDDERKQREAEETKLREEKEQDRLKKIREIKAAERQANTVNKDEQKQKWVRCSYRLHTEYDGKVMFSVCLFTEGGPRGYPPMGGVPPYWGGGAPGVPPTGGCPRG